MDRGIIPEAVKKDWDASQSAAEWLRADFEIVFGAVKQNCETLRYAAAEFSAGRVVILEAVTTDWEALQSAAEELCDCA